MSRIRDLLLEGLRREHGDHRELAIGCSLTDKTIDPEGDDAIVVTSFTGRMRITLKLEQLPDETDDELKARCRQARPT